MAHCDGCFGRVPAVHTCSGRKAIIYGVPTKRICGCRSCAVPAEVKTLLKLLLTEEELLDWWVQPKDGPETPAQMWSSGKQNEVLALVRVALMSGIN